MVLLVVLKGEKVYKVPIRSEIKLDHLKDFNTLRRILTPLVQLYHGVGFDTRLTYDEFSIFFNDLQHLGGEWLDEYSSGIQELVEVNPSLKMTRILGKYGMDYLPLLNLRSYQRY
jgi:hypothetical protein